MPLRVNASALAKATGLTKARVSQLKSKGIITPDKRGQYDLEDASNRIGRPIDLEQEASENLEEIKVVDFGKWRTFKMREDALKAKRERQVFEKDLLAREEVIKEVGQAFHVAKTKLLTIPTSISGIVAIESDAAICKEIIEGAIREVLAELSSEVGTSEDIQTTAQAHG